MKLKCLKIKFIISKSNKILVTICLFALFLCACKASPTMWKIKGDTDYGKVNELISTSNGLQVVYEEQNLSAINLCIEIHRNDGKVEKKKIPELNLVNKKLKNFSKGNKNMLYACRYEDEEIVELIKVNEETGAISTICEDLTYKSGDGKTYLPDGYVLTDKEEFAFFYNEIKCFALYGNDGLLKMQKMFPDMVFSEISYCNHQIFTYNMLENVVIGINGDDLNVQNSYEIPNSFGFKMHDYSWKMVGDDEEYYIVVGNNVYRFDKKGESLLQGIYKGVIGEFEEIQNVTYMNNKIYMNIYNPQTAKIAENEKNKNQSTYIEGNTILEIQCD